MAEGEITLDARRLTSRVHIADARLRSAEQVTSMNLITTTAITTPALISATTIVRAQIAVGQRYQHQPQWQQCHLIQQRRQHYKRCRAA